LELYGLHILDCSIIVLYVIIILWLGCRIRSKTKNTDDFYIAGRKLGKFYQFFLNFGNATDSSQAVGVSREIYRMGLGGMWIQFLVLFLTPFYWFTSMFYRRCRQITVGDYFTDRFKSPFLGGAFAVFTLLMAFVGGGASYMVAGKTMEAMTPKGPDEYTLEEKASVELFIEYKSLKDKHDSLKEKKGALIAADQARYDELNEMNKKGELRSFIPHINRNIFYIVYAIIVAIYTVLGGFTAAAITDAIQGVLIITFSLILIPIGLHKVGWFKGLHDLTPDYMFELFGNESVSEYTWYVILAMIIANLVSIVATAPSMAIAGSAKNEMTARIGIIGGMFFKRFIMLFWALAGLLAIALYSGEIHDPDLIWGHMSHKLLFTGGIGLMLAGILAANMSSLDALSVSNSALFIRNLYQPLAPGKSETHYINVGRIVIVVVVLGGIGAAVIVDNLLDLFKEFISLPAIFGAAIWLGFIWRRLTVTAVVVQVIFCFIICALIPNTFQHFNFINQHPGFLLETDARETTIISGALVEDVEKGLAKTTGESIEKTKTIEPTGVFFDKVVRIDPKDPDSKKIGRGRFNAEAWVISWLGFDFSGASKATLVSIRFFFDAFFPFVLLFLVSFFTRPVEKKHLDRFFGKMHTPVQPTLEQETEALEEAAVNPDLFEDKKIWPGSNWEILKPSKLDYLGFGGSWLMVGVIIFLLWLLVNIK